MRLLVVLSVALAVALAAPVEEPKGSRTKRFGQMLTDLIPPQVHKIKDLLLPGLAKEEHKLDVKPVLSNLPIMIDPTHKPDAKELEKNESEEPVDDEMFNLFAGFAD